MYIQQGNFAVRKVNSRSKLYQLSGLLLMCSVGLWQAIQDPLPLWVGGMVAVTALFLSQDKTLNKLERRWLWATVGALIFIPLFFGHVEPSHAFIWTKVEATAKTFASNAAGGSTTAQTAGFIAFVFNAMRFVFFGMFGAAVFQGWQSYKQNEDFGMFVNGMVGTTAAIGLIEVGSQVMFPALST